ncbi:MAG TPA: pentapeptide repeat-containing protein [Humisphaera sp.]|jgi:uncharacterized protein YjbI with pentapeptide repeats|nr:pentapeptide repeat-containing protein [Humisphaera sp.]
MGNAQILKGLLGKKVMFQGKFGSSWEHVRERLDAKAEAQQGLTTDKLDKDLDILVVPELPASQAIQKKVLALNAKGASVQVMDAESFEKMVDPTDADLLALMRRGPAGAKIFEKLFASGTRIYLGHRSAAPAHTFTGEKLDGTNLAGFAFDDMAFNQCSFVGSNFDDVVFETVTNSDFTDSSGTGVHFRACAASKFVRAKLKNANFQGSLQDSDFTSADLERAEIGTFIPFGAKKSHLAPGLIFAKATLRHASLDVSLKSPSFEGADLSASRWSGCTIEDGNFRGANFQNATLVGCKLKNSDFANANLRGANFAGADLSGSRFDGADLAGCSLRGATLQKADFSRARNYDPNAVPTGSVGPALTELDAINGKAKRINIEFHLDGTGGAEEDVVGVDTGSLKYGWGLRLPAGLARSFHHQRGSNVSLSDAMLELANIVGHRKVRYETVDVSSTKASKSGKELRELVIKGIVEAFAQPLPPEKELAEATRKHREEMREQGEADRERREAARKQAEKAEKAARAKIATKVAKAVGKVTDIATFLKALEIRVEKAKIDKATKMLKAERFKLFNDVTEEFVAGVVKSQTDPDLVYACRLDNGGTYACCTQNLNICGGLRGSICKHLLVLIIGLVKAGELDPTSIDEWIAKTHTGKPELDKEKMGEIFIKYKGAEAGEVDWRPTETLPEDYYAL